MEDFHVRNTGIAVDHRRHCLVVGRRVFERQARRFAEGIRGRLRPRQARAARIWVFRSDGCVRAPRAPGATPPSAIPRRDTAAVHPGPFVHQGVLPSRTTFGGICPASVPRAAGDPQALAWMVLDASPADSGKRGMIPVHCSPDWIWLFCLFEPHKRSERNRGVNQLALLSARVGEFESFTRESDRNR
jgi:hypothetical protein